MAYKIKTIINGKKHDLININEFVDVFLEEPYGFKKSIIRNYVACNFKDVMNNFKDIKEIKIFKGNTILFKYNYDKYYDPINEIILLMWNGI